MRCLSLPIQKSELLLSDLPDEWLLRIFVVRDDEESLKLLIERYKSMVFRICWRVLNHQQDAENAMQRTFFVLMRKARSIRDETSFKGWLRCVASRTAKGVLKYRMRINERERPQQITQITQITQIDDRLEYRELQALVDEGMQRLPEKIRVCFILHRLEGRSKKETAAKLGLPEGTVASRTARGRQLMQAWLAQHGITGP